MVDEPGRVLPVSAALPEAHIERVEREFRAQARGHLPADDEPAEHIDHERRVDPSGMGADIGQVRDPELTRCCRGERSSDEIRWPLRLRTITRGGLDRLIAPEPLQLELAHQSLDGATGNRDALSIQLGVDLPRPVDAEIVGMDSRNVGFQLLVSDRSGRGRARLGGVVGARGDLQARLTQDLADRLDPEPVSVLVDVVDEHRGGHPGYFSLRSSSAAQKSRGELNPSAQQCLEPIGWGVEVESLPGTGVQACGDRVEVGLGEVLHTDALREVLTQ